MATPNVTPRRTTAQPYPKPALYESISAINRDLGLVIDDLNRMREFKFSRRDIDGLIARAEYLRTRANAEFLEQQLDREMKDQFHFWQLDREYEDEYKDPNDVLIDAERRLAEMSREEREALAIARATREHREKAEKKLRAIVQPAKKEASKTKKNKQ